MFVVVNENVFRFEIAMDYIVLVNFDDPINNMRKDVKVVLSILFKRHVF